MRRAALAVVFAVTLLSVACGGGSSSSAPAALYTCDQSATGLAQCWQVAPAEGAFSSDDVTALQNNCTSGSGKGVWSAGGPCPTDGRIGTCTGTNPSPTYSVPVRFTGHFYEPRVEFESRFTCEHEMPGAGTWTPAPCTDGATQACYSGPYETRSVGTCMDGTQTCVNRQWADCLGDVVPATEACDGTGRDENCDGQVDEGFPVPANTCGTYGWSGISGDTGTDYESAVGWWGGDTWLTATFVENDHAVFGRDITGRITLSSPPGANFDLEVFCMECPPGGALIQRSSNGPGMQDQVYVWNWDLWGVEQSFKVIIHIYRVDEGVCAPWTLRVEGNTGKGDGSNPTCG